MYSTLSFAIRLLRRMGTNAKLVPDEAPPARRTKEGEEVWPEGWGPGRRVTSERDIFELLGVPYREPSERNCP